MKLTTRQQGVFNFVKKQHRSQERKYSNLPYWTHLRAVAELVGTHIKTPLAVEVALCHDLFEDTKCGYLCLYDKLSCLKYSDKSIERILESVSDLTDVYTKKRDPYTDRETRKKLEAERLWKIPAFSQSIKYCDLIDNTESICEYDPKFATIYLKEKRYILKGMVDGDKKLYGKCRELANKT